MIQLTEVFSRDQDLLFDGLICFEKFLLVDPFHISRSSIDQVIDQFVAPSMSCPFSRVDSAINDDFGQIIVSDRNFVKVSQLNRAPDARYSNTGDVSKTIEVGKLFFFGILH